MFDFLCIIGWPVQLIRRDFLRLHFRRRHTFASLWGACLRFASLWRANSCGESSAFIFQRFAEVWILSSWSVHLLKSLLNLRKAYIDLCLLNSPKRSSFRSLLLNFTLDWAFIFFSMVHHCLWKMSATPGACIKPGLVRRPLCHKVIYRAV